MQPSAIVAFAVGAALASGIVYVTVKPKAETLIRVESPVIAEQPPAQAPNAEREKPSPVARVLVPPAAAPPAKKSQKKPETPSASLPLTGSAAHLQLVSQRFPLTAPVRAELLPVPPPPPEPVQEAPTLPPEPTPVPPPPPAANTVTLRAGANLNVRVGETLSTRRNRVGDNFLATLTDPLVIDGWVIAERGARVEGRVVESDTGGRVQGTAHLSVELVRLTTSDGQRIRIQTQPIDRKANPSTGEDAAKLGGGAALGAIIGAVAGGGRGAGIGAGAGGAAGAGDVLLTRGKPAEIPVETRLGFRVASSVEITEQKQQR